MGISRRRFCFGSAKPSARLLAVASGTAIHLAPMSKDGVMAATGAALLWRFTEIIYGRLLIGLRRQHIIKSRKRHPPGSLGGDQGSILGGCPLNQNIPLPYCRLSMKFFLQDLQTAQFRPDFYIRAAAGKTPRPNQSATALPIQNRRDNRTSASTVQPPQF